MNAFRTSYGRARTTARRTMRLVPVDDSIAQILPHGTWVYYPG